LKAISEKIDDNEHYCTHHYRLWLLSLEDAPKKNHNKHNNNDAIIIIVFFLTLKGIVIKK